MPVVESSVLIDCVQLLKTADVSTSDVDGLHAKLDRKRKVEDTNATVQDVFHSKYVANMDIIDSRLRVFSNSQQQFLSSQRTALGKFCFACGILKCC